MRKIFLLALVTVMTISGCKAQDKEAKVYWSPIVEAAQTDLGQNEKLFFVDFSTSWCGWCKKMDRETFSDPVVAAILNKYFIPVHFNAEGNDSFLWAGNKYEGTPAVQGRPGTHTFARAVLGSRIAYPSFALFSPDQRLIQIFQGYYGPYDFSMILWYIVSHANVRYTWEQYQQIFDQEIKPQMMKDLGWKADDSNSTKPVQIYHE